jgi:uncharacterized protein DUF3558
MDGGAVSRIASAVSAGSLVLALAGCGGVGPNQHCDPVGCTYVPPTAESYSQTPDPNDPDDWFQTVDACTLLPAATRTQLGLPARGQSGADLSEHTCSWTGSKATLDVVLSPVLYDRPLLASGDQVTDVTTADGRRAEQITPPRKDGCAWSVQATAGSTMSLDLWGSASLARLCAEVRDAADAMAPKLPRG